MRFFVLGSNGLLGKHIMIQAGKAEFDTVPISRHTVPDLEQQMKDPLKFVQKLEANKGDFIVNALGVTRHRIENKAPGADSESVDLVNTQLPLALGRLAEDIGFKVIQIGTDCVFSGQKGNYTEVDYYDAEDVYGKSKAIGEEAPGIEVVRASFVGPTGSTSPYLWDWVQHQKANAKISGYSNVFWNGVTAEIHARLAVAIAKNHYPLEGTQHLVPANQVSKGQLVRLIADASGRNDITVEPTQVENPKNMTLSTQNESVNRELWKLISFEEVPTIEELILKDSGSI